jgi:hypothetical protein
MNIEIIQFVRNKKRQPVGIVVARKHPDGHVCLGWSRCCRLDRFNKNLGLELARGRTLGWVGNYRVPGDVKKVLETMKDRASRYFKS